MSKKLIQLNITANALIEDDAISPEMGGALAAGIVRHLEEFCKNTDVTAMSHTYQLVEPTTNPTFEILTLLGKHGAAFEE